MPAARNAGPAMRAADAERPWAHVLLAICATVHPVDSAAGRRPAANGDRPPTCWPNRGRKASAVDPAANTAIER